MGWKVRRLIIHYTCTFFYFLFWKGPVHHFLMKPNCMYVKKYLFTDSLSSFSSMTGSFWILFLLRFAEGVFGNKLILLTGLEQRWFKISFNSVIFIWNINTYIPSSKQQTSYNSKTVYESFIECMYAVVSSCFSDILKLGLGPLEIFIVHWTYKF